MILGLHDESKNLGSALNAHSVVPIQLGPTDPQVPLANVEHKQHRCRYDDRVWPVAPTLGIGTTSPAYTLDVAGRLQVTGSNGQTYVNLQDSTGAQFVVTYAGQQILNSTYNALTVGAWQAGNPYTIQTQGNTTALNIMNVNAQPLTFGTSNWERARIDASGNVGIGTTAPTAVVDILNPASPSASGQTVLLLESKQSGATLGSGPSIDFGNNWGGQSSIARIRGYAFGSSLSGLGFDTGYGATTTKMVIDNAGNVGIGTTNPTTKLTVNGGQILSTVFNAGASTAIDWNNGNVQYTSASCGAITLSNTLEGGAYTLIVTGTSSGTCTFTQTVPDSTMATYKFSPPNAATTASSTSTYTMIRAGNILYISWITGF